MGRKRYKVLLHRDYAVEISAENEVEAMEFAEFFVTGGLDGSTKSDRSRYNFEIERIKSITNDVFAVEDIDNG